MFTYIKGKLVTATPSQVVVDVHGIGYAILIPCRLLGELPHLGQEVQLHTSFVVREASHTLYGFLCNQERDLFEFLMNISGVGPKLSLSLIGHLPVAELQTAVSCQDLSTLCRVPGVGKKTAERLVLELKDKLSNSLPGSIGSLGHLAISVPDSQSSQARDAMLALMNLGYNQGSAQKAIKQSLKDLPDDVDLSLLITTALRNI